MVDESFSAPGVITCGACGSRYERAAWASLPLAGRVPPEEVRRVLVDWSDEFCIEVRSCRRCGKQIASKRRVRG
jgi:hypothetical protein